jgi:hypothetical protein
MRCAVVLVAVLAVLGLAADVAKAECSAGWTFNVEAKLDELFYVQGKVAVQRIEITVKAFPYGGDDCGLLAWSRIEGVSVDFLHLCAPNPSNPDASCPGPGETASTDFSYAPFSEYPNQMTTLLVYVSASAKEGSGIIELYKLALPGYPSRFIPVGTIKIHIKKPLRPDQCPPVLFQPRLEWDYGVVPGGWLNHERVLPANLAQSLQQMGVQMSYLSQSSLPPSLNFTLDPITGRGLVIGSVPQEHTNYQLLMNLLDISGCERGKLSFTMSVQPQPDAPLSVSANATANQICGPQFSHELTVSWQISGVQASTEIKIEITGPDGKVETLGTQTLEGTRTFALAYPGGGSVSIKVTAQEGGSSSSAQSSVQLGACQ